MEVNALITQTISPTNPPIQSEQASQAPLIGMEFKKKTNSVSESYENMAMNAAILSLAVCVCNVMNKVKMCDGSVH